MGSPVEFQNLLAHRRQHRRIGISIERERRVVPAGEGEVVDAVIAELPCEPGVVTLVDGDEVADPEHGEPLAPSARIEHSQRVDQVMTALERRQRGEAADDLHASRAERFQEWNWRRRERRGGHAVVDRHGLPLRRRRERPARTVRYRDDPRRNVLDDPAAEPGEKEFAMKMADDGHARQARGGGRQQRAAAVVHVDDADAVTPNHAAQAEGERDHFADRDRQPRHERGLHEPPAEGVHRASRFDHLAVNAEQPECLRHFSRRGDHHVRQDVRRQVANELENAPVRSGHPRVVGDQVEDAQRLVGFHQHSINLSPINPSPPDRRRASRACSAPN